jgi:hypothetical protein
MTLDVTIKKETELAILVETDDGDEHWIPKSVVDGLDLSEGDSGEIEVQDWFAEKEGL